MIQFTAQLADLTKGLEQGFWLQRQLQPFQVVGIAIAAAALVHRLIGLEQLRTSTEEDADHSTAQRFNPWTLALLQRPERMG